MSIKKPSPKSKNSKWFSSIKNERDIIIATAVMKRWLKMTNEKGYLLREIPKDELEIYELWQRLQHADEAIQYLVDFIMKHHSDYPLIDVCKNTKDEIDRLYNAIIKAAKKQKQSISVFDQDLIEKAVYKEYCDNFQSFKYIKHDHLKINYKFTGGKEKRDFRDAIIRKMMEEMRANVKDMQNKIPSFL